MSRTANRRAISRADAVSCPGRMPRSRAVKPAKKNGAMPMRMRPMPMAKMMWSNMVVLSANEGAQDQGADDGHGQRRGEPGVVVKCGRGADQVMRLGEQRQPERAHHNS